MSYDLKRCHHSLDGLCLRCVAEMLARRDKRIGEFITERDKLAKIVTRNDGAVERSQGLARELGEALTAKTEVREQLGDMAMSNAQLLLDNLDLQAAKAELVAVLCGVMYEEDYLGSATAAEMTAAIAKHGGDDARAEREAELTAQGFEKTDSTRTQGRGLRTTMNAEEALRTLTGIRMSDDPGAPDCAIEFKSDAEGLWMNQGPDKIYMSWDDFERLTFMGALLLKAQQERHDER